MKRVTIPVVELIAAVADFFPPDADGTAMQTGARRQRLLLLQGKIQIRLITFFFGNAVPHAPVIGKKLFLANRQRGVHVPPSPMSGNALVDLVDQLVN